MISTVSAELCGDKLKKVVRSAYGSGSFLGDLEKRFKDDDRLSLSEIANREAIYDAIKTFLGKGK